MVSVTLLHDSAMPCLIIASYALIIATYAMQTENDPRKSAVALLHMDADSSRGVSDAVLFNRFNASTPLSKEYLHGKNGFVERSKILAGYK